MMKLVAVTALGIALASGAASAQDRAVNTGLGAVAGALVAGPVGAVAGGAIGYGAGHQISRGLGLSGRKSHRHRRAYHRRGHDRRAGR
jgi:membrane protein DedA with SNARE-associated domain